MMNIWLGVISNGLDLLYINSFWQKVATGMLILIAVTADALRSRTKKQWQI